MKSSVIQSIKQWRILLPLKTIKRILHAWLLEHVLKTYWYWILRHEWQFFRKWTFQKATASLQQHPIITLITNIEKGAATDSLFRTIRSVSRQYYPDWEWYLFVDSEELQQLAGYIPAQLRHKIHLLSHTESNAATWSGEFSAFLSAGDELAPFALSEVVKTINVNPQACVVYSDEDHIRGKRTRYDPWFKPHFNIYNLRSGNYLEHFLVIKTNLVQKIVAQEVKRQILEIHPYDLILRCVEQTSDVIHIPAVLYHSRKARLDSKGHPIASTTNPLDELALRNHLERMHIQADVLPNDYPDSFRVHYAVQGSPLVSIIIPNKDQRPILQRCIDSILEKTTYPNYEIIIAENNSQTPEIFTYYEELKGRSNFPGQILCWDSPFNYSAINNWAAEQSSGEYLLFLNNDIEVITPQWIEEMLGLAQQPDVGAVGVKLCFPDGRLQHAGAGFDRYIPDSVYHFAQGVDGKKNGYYGIFTKVNTYSCVTAACLMVNKQKFFQAGKFDEIFSIDLNDVDLCLQLLQKKWFNLFTPYAELVHHESLSRGYDTNSIQIQRAKQDFSKLKIKWKDFVVPADPFLSPYLRFEQYSLDFFGQK
ncbi:glycosyltransferase family 2 protein [Flexilinea flocculi]|uniref:Glycosyltransferase, GT2 family n=1 Tax=Flexilinea flocculi TaxID=1678840 RepID=A0A0K8PBG0_9CHLR|nr:glycosyltransferase family 2 protein [Flexilinea flocculi]GAP39485.1 glycosyltransferase, GT2 family [Flexilinea flocculi]